MRSSEFRMLADASARGTMPFSILKERSSGASVLRAEWKGERVIIKRWRRSPLRSFLRRLTMTGCGAAEWSALVALHRRGLPVPRPLHHTFRGTCEIIVMEDLGGCRDITEVMKDCVKREDASELARIEDAVIAQTVAMLRWGWVDIDCRLPNFVVDTDNRIYRLDLELARRRLPLGCAVQATGRMIGTLMATHVFAMQPHTERSLDFARRLTAARPLGRLVLRDADRVMAAMIDRQSQEIPIQTRVSFRLEDMT